MRVNRKRLRDFSEYTQRRWKEKPGEATQFLQHALQVYKEDGELKYLLCAIKDVLKAKGVSEIAKKSGLSRQELERSLRPNNEPKISTLRAILKSLGYSMTFSFKKKKK